MAILITGAGVIGCHSARLLAERGASVVLLDLQPDLEAIATIVDPARVEVVTGNVAEFSALAVLVERSNIDQVVHTAAMLTSGMKSAPLAGVMANVIGATNFLELARLGHLKRVVLSSSTTIGYSTFHTRHKQAIPVDLPMRIVSERPYSLYSVTKLAGEHIAGCYKDQFGIDVLCLRYGAVVSSWPGRNQSIPGRLFSSILRPALAGEAVIIDDASLLWLGGEEFVDARDCAQGNVDALDSESVHDLVYNISRDQLYTVDDVVSLAREMFPDLVVDIRAQIRGGLAGSPWVRSAPSDLSASARDLHYEPRHDLRASLQHFADVFQGAPGVDQASADPP